MLGIAPSTLYSLCAQGKVPHRRLAGLKFTQEDLDAILESSKVAVKDERQHEPQPRRRLKHIEVR
jgi:hypothetical protein